MQPSALGQVTDVIILGGGHAGLSAALTLYRQQHTCLIPDSNKPRNSWKFCNTCHSRLGRGRGYGISRKNCRGASFNRVDRIRRMQLIEFVECTLTNVKKRDDGLFETTDSNGQKYEARKILVAVGKEHLFPNIPGYEENVTHGMQVSSFHVPFVH
jgi:thioredoxin reductase